MTTRPSGDVSSLAVPMHQEACNGTESSTPCRRSRVLRFAVNHPRSRTRFTGQIVSDVGEGNRRNRIHDDVALVHRVTTTDLYMGTRPDANAGSDSPVPDSIAKAFGEHHMEPHPIGICQASCSSLAV